MAADVKRRRARPSGIHLTEADAAQAKGMLLRGDRQHDIASWFGVNPGRIAEIATRLTYGWVLPAASDKLPPPGPYVSGRVALAAITTLSHALATAEKNLRPYIG